MRAVPVEIKWHPGLPIFACESFLKSVGDEHGWLGGIDEAGELRCILPYVIIRKATFRMVRFQVETIFFGKELSVDEERSFLNYTVDYFRSIGAHMIIPATANAIFRTYPDMADAAPYGSYIIDLTQPEDVLWRNIRRITRQNINTASKDGVSILSGTDYLDVGYQLVVDTYKRSKFPFMSYNAFKRYVNGLGSNGRTLVADYMGVIQSYVVFAFSEYSAYAVYGGNVANQHQGAIKMLFWESMRLFKELGVQRYDFMGARIAPEKGSKQYAINSVKRRFGAKLKQGYIWKYSLRPFGFMAYNLAVRVQRGGDIVDNERHKLQN